MRSLKRMFLKILDSGAMIPIALLILWWWGARSGWWSEFLLPGPGRVIDAFASMAKSGEIGEHIRASLARIAKGFSLSAIFALSLASSCGLFRPLMRQLGPALSMLRHIPPMATIPLLILWFGIGEASKLVIIIMATFFPIFLNTLQGIIQCDPKLVEVARSFGLSRGATLIRVVLPSAVPYIITGMRLGLGYSWRSLIACELIAASSGLGYLVIDAQQLSRSDVIIAGILMIALLGSVMDMAFAQAARILSHGEVRSDGMA